MTFNIKIANYVLGNLSSSEFPELARTGMEEGMESNALSILAGMNSNDNIFELRQYFQEMVRELNITFPDKLNSARILIKHYLSEMIEHPKDSFRLMNHVNDIYNSHDWIELYPDLENEFLGQPLGLQNLFTWYRELSDFEDGDRLFYYNELPPKEQKEKFNEHLIEEAEIWIDNFNSNN